MQAEAGEQGTQAEAIAFAYVPKGQVAAVKAQVVAPLVLKDPAAQGRHTEEDIVPEKVPAAQGLQVELSAAPRVVL